VLEAAVNVVITVPSPGAANADLASDAVTPAGRPVQDRATAELKIPWWALLTLSCPVIPSVMVNALCAAVKPKLLAVTASEKGYLVVKPPLLAAIMYML
jgi:hypothetical protein